MQLFVRAVSVGALVLAGACGSSGDSLEIGGEADGVSPVPTDGEPTYLECPPPNGIMEPEYAQGTVGSATAPAAMEGWRAELDRSARWEFPTLGDGLRTWTAEDTSGWRGRRSVARREELVYLVDSQPILVAVFAPIGDTELPWLLESLQTCDQPLVDAGLRSPREAKE